MRASITLIIAIPVLVGLASVAVADGWEPPEPDSQTGDWVKLSSGEWVRGKVELLQNERMAFDSDELDDLEFDWEDVLEIRTARTITVGFVDRTRVTGTITLRDGILKVRTESGVEEYDAGLIHAMIQGRPTERNYWSLKSSANLVARSGNTEQNDFNSFLRIRRQTTMNLFNFEYRGNYGAKDGLETVSNSRMDIDAKVFLSRQLFVTPLGVDLFSDKFQNIDLRSGISAGLGYYIIRSATDWHVTAGGGWQRTVYESVVEGEDPNIDNGTATVATTLETDLTSNIELDAEYSVRRSFGLDETTLHRAYLMLSFDVFGDILDFTASVAWDHNMNPKANGEGVTPKKTDLTMAYGLGVDF